MTPAGLQLERWGGLAVPRWATPRDPSCPTYGPAVAQVMRALGRTPIPWQSAVADVAGEVITDDAGRPLRMRYPVVVILVPRRGGKTLLTLGTSIQRASAGRDRRVWYTAQNGMEAADTFREEWVPMVKASPLAKYLRVRLSNGSQGLSFPADLGSRLGIFAPTPSALHGKDGDYITVDEAWAFGEDGGAALEAALRPTMLTRPMRQLVIVSAGGTDASTWLLRYRALGRQLVDEGGCDDSGVCFVEWCPPDGADLDDPRTWAQTHPAVGATITLDTLRADRATAVDVDAFHRGILNVFTSAAGPRVLPLEFWEACRWTEPEAPALPERGVPTLGVDVSEDRTHGAVTIAWQLPDGRSYAELVDHGPRQAVWLEERVAQLRGKYRAKVRATRDGPVATTVAGLARRGIKVDTLTRADQATEAAALLDDVVEGRLRLWRSPQLDAAAGGAATQRNGDGWSWVRRASGPDISPLVSLTAALGPTRARQLESAARRMVMAS